MTHTPSVARWAVLIRWTFYLGLGAALLLGYASSKSPLAAADKPGDKPTADAAADETPAQLTPDLTPEEAGRLGEKAVAEGERARKEEKKQQPARQDKKLDLIQVVLHGGVHMWMVAIILLLSVVTMAFAIERVFGLRRSKVMPAELMAGLKALAAQKGGFDPRELQRLCREYPSAAATIVAAMLQKVGRPLPEIEKAVAEASEREASRLYANVRWQNLAFNVAPMLGLAGTVYGVILAFFDLAKLELGANKMEALATGIYTALICTLAGLIVAIPAGVLAHAFEGRILKMFRRIDDVVLALVPQLERFEGKARGKAADPAAVELATGEPKPKWPAARPTAQ